MYASAVQFNKKVIKNVYGCGIYVPDYTHGNYICLCNVLVLRRNKLSVSGFFNTCG